MVAFGDLRQRNQPIGMILPDLQQLSSAQRLNRLDLRRNYDVLSFMEPTRSISIGSKRLLEIFDVPIINYRLLTSMLLK